MFVEETLTQYFSAFIQSEIFLSKLHVYYVICTNSFGDIFPQNMSKSRILSLALLWTSE